MYNYLYTQLSQPKREELIVAYESRTAGGLVWGEVQTHLLFGENLLHAIFWVAIYVNQHACCFQKFFSYSE